MSIYRSPSFQSLIPHKKAAQEEPAGRHMEHSTKKQKQIIHILEHQLVSMGLLDDKGYRLLLMGWFGRESSRDLSHEEASVLIDQLVKMGGVISRGAKLSGHGQHNPVQRFVEEGSIKGLRNEIILIAKERYGEDFERPLTALCNKLNIRDYRSMDVRHAKAIKETLLRLQAAGPFSSKKKSTDAI
jgi:hypothetical protein